MRWKTNEKKTLEVNMILITFQSKQVMINNFETKISLFSTKITFRKVTSISLKNKQQKNFDRPQFPLNRKNREKRMQQKKRENKVSFLKKKIQHTNHHFISF